MKNLEQLQLITIGHWFRQTVFRIIILKKNRENTNNNLLEGKRGKTTFYVNLNYVIDTIYLPNIYLGFDLICA